MAGQAARRPAGGRRRATRRGGGPRAVRGGLSTPELGGSATTARHDAVVDRIARARSRPPSTARRRAATRRPECRGGGPQHAGGADPGGDQAHRARIRAPDRAGCLVSRSDIARPAVPRARPRPARTWVSGCPTPRPRPSRPKTTASATEGSGAATTAIDTADNATLTTISLRGLPARPGGQEQREVIEATRAGSAAADEPRRQARSAPSAGR